MKGNCFGRVFRVSTWGESHGAALGALIEGCPSGIPLLESDFHLAMQSRRGGQSPGATPRAEADLVSIESGVFEGLTTGTPISLRIVNSNVRSEDYEAFRRVPRPGHADLTTALKHPHRDHRGGGRSSARETVARVAAGEIARKILAQSGIEVMAFVRRIGSIEVSYEEVPFHSESSEKIHNFWWPSIAAARAQSRFRLPSLSYEERIAALADRAKENEDSWGGSVECWVKGLPAGLGEPVFDKLGAVLGHALLSLPAAVAFQVGGGESLAGKPGSMSRDPIVAGVHHPRPSGNLHGGLLGGISTGEPLWAKVDFHAPTSLPQATASVNLDSGNPQLVRVIGRHDSIPLPRAVPMVEAMVMLVLADAMLLA